MGVEEKKIIEIVDSGEARYCVRANFEVLGRQYEHLAESVEVVKPESEADSVCTMVVSHNGAVIDHIEVKDEPIYIESNLTQYPRVKIGFSFLRADGSVKNSGVQEFYFLKAQRPNGFEASVPVYSGNVDRLISLAFADVDWKEGSHNTLVFKGINGNSLKEIELHGFSQEQADLGEVDDSKSSFVQGKKTSNLENDGDGKSPFATKQFVLDNQKTGDNIQESDPTVPSYVKAISEEDIDNWNSKVDADYVDNIEKDARKVLVLGATGSIGTNANFEVSDVESYLPYRNNLTEFVFSGIIPVTGEVDLTKQVTITFGDTSYYVFSAVDTSKRLTLGDLDFALRESLVTGYNYLFRTVFFENKDSVGFAVLPDKEDVLSLDSDQMDNFMADGGLPQGQLAICNKVISNGYTEGGVYRFKITYPSTYEWEELVPSRLRDLTLTQSGSMLQSTQTFVGQHIHAMIEFDTDGVHYGADFILHPCDSAICLVSYRFGTHDGTAYLDDSGRVNISIPDSLSFTNFKGHYMKL